MSYTNDRECKGNVVSHVFHEIKVIFLPQQIVLTLMHFCQCAAYSQNIVKEKFIIEIRNFEIRWNASDVHDFVLAKHFRLTQ